MFAEAMKLVTTVGGLARVCGPTLGLRYLMAVFATLPQVRRDRTLQAPDRRMQGSALVLVGKTRLDVPFSAADAANPVLGDACTFSGIRELYVGRVYQRGFHSIGPVETFVDLGANRGMVSVMAARELGAELVLAVEAQDVYEACFRVLADANGLTARQRLRVIAKAGGIDGNDIRTVTSLCAEHGLTKIDFLKCDVEGAENEIFLEDGSFLDMTSLVAAELHPDRATRSAEIVQRMAAAGFFVSLADSEGRPAAADRADYLYAAKDQAILALPIVAGPS